jgi:ribose 5-phosphate isomerase
MAATGLSMPISGASRMRRVWRACLSLIPGVVEHGLFIGLASTAVLAVPREFA